MGGQMVSGTCVIKRFQANRVRCACAGVSPVFVAFVLAVRRRAWTTAAGTRAAIRRAAPGAWAPSTRGGSRLGRAPVAKRAANSTRDHRAATAASRGV